MIHLFFTDEVIEGECKGLLRGPFRDGVVAGPITVLLGNEGLQVDRGEVVAGLDPLRSQVLNDVIALRRGIGVVPSTA